jgi:hypothetical protein
MSLNAQPAELLVEYLEKLRQQDVTIRGPGVRRPTPVVGGAEKTGERLEKAHAPVEGRGLTFNDKENVPPRLARPTSTESDKSFLVSPTTLAPPLVTFVTEPEPKPEILTPKVAERTQLADMLAASAERPVSSGERRDEPAKKADHQSGLQTPRVDHDEHTVIRLDGSGNRLERPSDPASTGLQSRFRRMDRKRLGKRTTYEIIQAQH